MKAISWAIGHFVILLFLLAAPKAFAERRLALIISNTAYGEASPSASAQRKDGDALREELSQDGFEVQFKENLTKQGMKSALDAFQSQVKTGDAVLFFFNGIGLQLGRQSYILPTNAQIWTELDIKRDGFSLDAILSDLSSAGAGVKIMIIDAARHNPFEPHFRDVAAGLAAVDTPPGSLVLMSTSPGKQVAESAVASSLFMNELVKQTRLPGSAEDAFKRVRVGVYNSSKGEQVPWVSSSLLAEFSFVKARTAASSATSNPPPAGSVNEDRRYPNAAAQPQPPASSPVRVASAASPAGFTFRDCDGCPELVVVPRGEFSMGSSEHPNEKPAHRIKIGHPFAIGRYEITYGEWDRCVEQGACRYRPDDHGWGRGDIPAGDISWEDTADFIKWVSMKTGQPYRLPSEAEWEYAARAGSTKRFWWGDEPGSGNANCADCGAGGSGRPAVAGSFKPNAFGLFDTAGNMAEWVQDCWNESYKGGPADGAAWLNGNCSLRGLRGGSFGNKAQLCRPSARFRYDSDVRYLANGFRVVRELR